MPVLRMIMKTVWPAVLLMAAGEGIAAMPVAGIGPLPSAVVAADAVCGPGWHVETSGRCRRTVQPVPDVPRWRRPRRAGELAPPPGPPDVPRWQPPRKAGELPPPPVYRPPALPEQKAPPKWGQLHRL